MEVGLALIFSGIIILYLSSLDRTANAGDYVLPGTFLVLAGTFYIILGG